MCNVLYVPLFIVAFVCDPGGECYIVPGSLPLYSKHMQNLSQQILEELRDILPAPKYR